MVVERLSDAERAQRHRTKMRERRRAETRQGQDIGAIPAVGTWTRRDACELDLELFCQTYWPGPPYFYLPFCDDHRRVIAKAEEAIVYGGLFALAMPRGFGKTQLCRAATIWALLYGYRRFVFFVSATAGHATTSLDAVKAMLAESEPLAEDFPEVVWPILALEGEVKRQAGQRCLGQKTEIHWGGDFVRLPTVPAQSSVKPAQLHSGGAKIHISGLTGSKVRGFNVRGERPDLLIVDDPQTDDSANSVRQCEKRESILAGMAMGLAAPGTKIAGIMPCTVIRQGDVADNILDHAKHPEWDSSRTKMLYSFPTDMQLWDRYKEIRNNYNPYADDNDKKRAAAEASEFYLSNVEAMQAGAVVAWPELYGTDELDALQSAMNLYFQDRRKFFAEKQNEPLPPDLGKMTQLTSDEICKKLSRLDRGKVHLDATTLTAFIDVQQTVLYWLVAAWRPGFTGWVVDYGTWPDQGKAYFTLDAITRTLARETKVAGVEGQIVAGLRSLTDLLMQREWMRETGGPMRINQLLIDSGKWTKLIYNFIRANPFGPNAVLPSKGKFVGATTAKDVDEGAQKSGDLRGLKWSLPAAKEDRGVKLLTVNVNFWKTFVHERLAVGEGNPGCLSLFGIDDTQHKMLADHLTSESASEVKSQVRECVQWSLKPGNPDNHLFDCLVGAAVAASVQGITLEGIYKAAKPKKRKRISFSAEFENARRKAS